MKEIEITNTLEVHLTVGENALLAFEKLYGAVLTSDEDRLQRAQSEGESIAVLRPDRATARVVDSEDQKLDITFKRVGETRTYEVFAERVNGGLMICIPAKDEVKLLLLASNAGSVTIVSEGAERKELEGITAVSAHIEQAQYMGSTREKARLIADILSTDAGAEFLPYLTQTGLYAFLSMANLISSDLVASMRSMERSDAAVVDAERTEAMQGAPAIPLPQGQTLQELVAEEDTRERQSLDPPQSRRSSAYAMVQGGPAQAEPVIENPVVLRVADQPAVDAEDTDSELVAIESKQLRGLTPNDVARAEELKLRERGVLTPEVEHRMQEQGEPSKLVTPVASLGEEAPGLGVRLWRWLTG